MKEARNSCRPAYTFATMHSDICTYSELFALYERTGDTMHLYTDFGFAGSCGHALATSLCSNWTSSPVLSASAARTSPAPTTASNAAAVVVVRTALDLWPALVIGRIITRPPDRPGAGSATGRLRTQSRGWRPRHCRHHYLLGRDGTGRDVWLHGPASHWWCMCAPAAIVFRPVTIPRRLLVVNGEIRSRNCRRHLVRLFSRLLGCQVGRNFANSSTFLKRLAGRKCALTTVGGARFGLLLLPVSARFLSAIFRPRSASASVTVSEWAVS